MSQCRSGHIQEQQHRHQVTKTHVRLPTLSEYTELNDTGAGAACDVTMLAGCKLLPGPGAEGPAALLLAALKRKPLAALKDSLKRFITSQLGSSLAPRGPVPEQLSVAQ